ncbi:acyltransferase family protein [Longirhabdus pacifica]|uniref:acyltransferase family protein n=1 Tax=Longirhabdus pacifica TaxID=2305227 RepID=UPI001008D416|nr:acyltransferase [Longirhabdus pacifica]
MKKLSLLQSFRAIAPVLILLLHAAQIYDVNFMYMLKFEKTGGVDLFFVMSGFLLYYIYNRKFGENGQARNFLLKRITRIMPLVWVLTLFFFAASYIGLWEPYASDELLGSLFVLPTSEHILDTTWSLSHMVFFYLMMAIVIWQPLWRLPMLAIVSIMTLYLYRYGFLGEDTILSLLTMNYYNFEFLLGCIAAAIVMKVRIRGAFVYLIAGIIGYAYTWYVMTNGIESRLPLEMMFGPAAFLLVLGGAGLDQTRNINIPKPIQILEQSSYALYLSHYPLLIISMYLYDVNRWFEYISSAVAYSLVCTVIVCISTGIHYVVEKPLDRFVQRLVQPLYSKAKPKDEVKATAVQ